MAAGGTTLMTFSTSNAVVFPNTGTRIMGDFSNATPANRVMLQSSVTNGATNVGLVPNGTGDGSAFVVYAKSDVASSEYVSLGFSGALARLSVNKNGSGGSPPLAIAVGSGTKYQIDSNGNHHFFGMSSNFLVPAIFTSDVDIRVSSDGKTSNKLYLRGNNYSPHMRANSDLPGFEWMPSGGSTRIAALSETGVFTASGRVESNGAANAASPGVSFESIGQVGTQYVNWKTACGALQVDAADYTKTYFALRWVRPGDRCFAAISATQLTPDVDNPSITFYLDQNYSGTASWAWSFEKTNIRRSDGSMVALNAPSDYRLKRDVKDLEGSLDRVMRYRPVRFTWIGSGERDSGFIADEVQEIEPRAVTGKKDAMRVTPDGNTQPSYQSLDKGYLMPDAIGAIQALKLALDAALERVQLLEQALKRGDV
jgi:hypothetical protein